MLGFATILATTLATLAAGKKHNALRGVEDVKLFAGETTNVTTIKMINSKNQIVKIEGDVTEDCKKYIVASSGTFAVPFGKEKEFTKEFRKQCKGAIIQGQVSNFFDPAQKTACKGKNQSYRFYHNKNMQTLGERIDGQRYMILATETTCAAPPKIYRNDKKGECKTAEEAKTIGTMTITGGQVTLLTNKDWKYEDIVLDLSACTVKTTSYFVGDEVLAVKGAASLFAGAGALVLTAAAASTLY